MNNSNEQCREAPRSPRPMLFPAEGAVTGAGAAGFPALTERECTVLDWLKEGKTNWEIATILAISERTVKFHVANIREKLSACSRSHAVALAYSYNLIKR